MPKTMKLFAVPAFALALGLYVAPMAGTQESAGSQATAASAKTTVTGCLQKGDEKGEYSLTAQDGKTYGLRGKGVDFAKHVGHKVEVTGTMRPESAEKGKHEAKGNATSEKMEAGDIRVTNLKHLSETCP